MKLNFTGLLLSVLLLTGLTSTHAQQSYYYDFRNSFAEINNSGPALNVLGTGAFNDSALPELSCLTRPVYGFTQNSGVQFDNTAAGGFISNSYSVEMYFEFLNNSGFKRLIDFKNQTSDFGLYCTAGELQFYDAITIPTTAFVANQYVHLVVTREAVSSEVNLYVDGALLGSFIDTTGLGLLDNSNVLNFFQDDLVFGGEARPGNIALLKIYNTAIDSATVAANFSDLKQTSNTLSFTASAASTCLFGNNLVFTNTSQSAGTVNYLWTFGDGGTATTASASYSYPTFGNYTVQLLADDGAGCTDSVSTAITVFPDPVINLGADTTVCDGTTLTLDPGAGYSLYLWNDGSTNQTFDATLTGTYSVTVTDANACSATDSVSYIFESLPFVELGNDTSICFGTSITLSATAGYAGYLWSTGDTTETIVASATETYAVQVFSALGCIGTDNIAVTVLPELIISLGNDTAFCDGNTLVISPGNSFPSVVWNDGSTNPDFTVNTSGTYSVVVTNDFGCTATDSINVLVDAVPVVSLGADTTLCFGSNIVLSATPGATSYTWSTGDTTETITAITSGIYAVEIANATGCTASDTIEVVINPAIIVDLGPDAVICSAQPAILNAGTGYASYLWQDGSTDSTYTVNTTGVYNVTVTDIFGCTGTDDISIIVNQSPVTNLGNDTTICGGTPLVLDGGAGFTSYLWSDGSQNQTLNISSGGIYAVTVTDANGCSATDEIIITGTPLISLGPDFAICDGQTASLDAGPGFSSYQWSDGSFTQTINVTLGGTYTVTVTDSTGCFNSDDVIINVVSAPLVELGPDQSICNGTAVVLDAGAGNYSYLWNDGSTSQLFLVSVSGTYSVTVTDLSAGCESTDAITVTVLPAPIITLGADTTLCDGTTLVLDAGAGFSGYLWNDGSVAQTYNVSGPGLYTVTVTDVNNCAGSDDIEVTYFAPVPTPVITQNLNTLQSSAATGNQWYSVPGGLIPGATAQTYSPPQNGTFYVVVTDSNGCQSAPSSDFIFVNSGIAQQSAVTLLVAPNPVTSDFITLETSGLNDRSIEVQLFDIAGKRLMHMWLPSNSSQKINISTIAPGACILKVSNAEWTETLRLLIAR